MITHDESLVRTPTEIWKQGVERTKNSIRFAMSMLREDPHQMIGLVSDIFLVGGIDPRARTLFRFAIKELERDSEIVVTGYEDNDVYYFGSLLKEANIKKYFKGGR